MHALALLALCVFGAACHPQAPQWFRSSGYHVNTDRYGFLYLNDRYPDLLPPDWTLDNFTRDGGDLQVKTRGAYVHEMPWTMEDGSEQRATVVTHDLLFRHSQSNGAIWVRRVPLPRSARGKAVRVLAENYANGISGSIYEASLGDVVTERRVTTRVLHTHSITVAGRTAQDVAFELVDLSKLELDPNAPRKMARIIMIEGAFDKPLTLRPGPRGPSSRARVPAVLLIGYVNDASAYDSQAPAFQSLLTRIWIR